MPLISDSTQIFVGNTPITTVLAGEDVVWTREKLADIQFYYETTNPDFNQGPGRTSAIYASWVTNERPKNCSDILGQFGIQHTFDRISGADPDWKLVKWDDAVWRAIPASTPGLMVMQAHGNMYPYDTRFRLSRNANSINYPEVYSDEFRVGATGSTDPAYTLYTDLPKLPFEWLAESGCSPPLIVPKPYTVFVHGVWYHVVFFEIELENWQYTNCTNMKTFLEYNLEIEGNYTGWLPFRGWVDPYITGGTRKLCKVWMLYMSNQDFPVNGSGRAAAYVREPAGGRSYAATYLRRTDPQSGLKYSLECPG